MKRYKVGASLGLFLLVSLFVSSAGRSQYLEEGVRYAPNRIVVAFSTAYVPTIEPTAENGVVITGIAGIDRLNREFRVSRMRRLFPEADKDRDPEMAGYFALTFETAVTLDAILSAYDGLTEVEHVEPVGIHRINFVPNDPYLSTQWALTRVDAREAWDITRGDSTVPLAILDSGVDWNHPDLDDNIWTNGSDPIDGLDNDSNGKIDDFRGWDWVNGQDGWPGEDDVTEDNNPMDFDGHGTHVAGITSAETNNYTGVAGLGYNCEIMCLRIGWRDADGFTYVAMDYAASAVNYARTKGAKAINCSWGSSNSGGLGTAVTQATNAGVVVVTAAGNDDNQIAPYLGTRSDIIAVAATDQTDHKASFSSYGAWVDVSAPGVSIRSTYYDNTYDYLDGTSMAAPHVTGLVGLIRSVAPGLTRYQVTQQIITTAEDIDLTNPAYAGLLGSGRINAYNAVVGLGGSLTAPIPVSPVGSVWINSFHPTFIWSDTSSATVYNLQVDDATSFASPIIDNLSISDTSYTAPDSLVDDTWYWRIRGGTGSFWGDYSGLQVFRLDTAKPNTATLLTPAPNSWTNNRAPYFSWSAVEDPGGSGVNLYYIQISLDSLFTLPLFFEDSLPATGYYLPYYLPADTRVFWRVRSRDLAGNLSDYAVAGFNIDNQPPGSPLSLDIWPDFWTADSAFSLDWLNPAEQSGFSMALYKVGSAPTSNYDTTGRLPATGPAEITVRTTGKLPVFLWLVDGAGNTSYSQRIQDTVRFDNTPPSGCDAASPAISGSLSFTVSWTSGTDIGSGTAGRYDVRVRDGAEGSWSDWLIDFAELSGAYSGEHGHTYFFEARTRDLVGNLEPFMGLEECQTVVDTTYIGPPFLPGDANGTGVVNGIDVVYLVNYLKGGPPPPEPMLRADANGSCTVNGIDVVYLVNFLKGGPAPYAGDCR